MPNKLAPPLNPIQFRMHQLAKATEDISATSGGVSTSIGALQRGIETKLGVIATEIGAIGERPNGEPSLSNDTIEALLSVTPKGSIQRNHWFGKLMKAAKLDGSIKAIAMLRGDHDQVIAEVKRRFDEAALSDRRLKSLTKADVVVIVRAAKLIAP